VNGAPPLGRDPVIGFDQRRGLPAFQFVLRKSELEFACGDWRQAVEKPGDGNLECFGKLIEAAG
jgi:hypothetical protein